MSRSFRSNTFYKVAPLSSREDFGRHFCPQENRRCLAGLSFEETIEFEALEALPPLDDNGNVGWTFEGEPTTPREKRWLELYRKHELALRPKRRRSGFAWHKEKVMEPSIDELLVRQVSALVSTTADAVCTKGENVPSMEAQFYEILAIHCAEKQRLAAAAFANSVAARAQKGLIYW